MFLGGCLVFLVVDVSGVLVGVAGGHLGFLWVLVGVSGVVLGFSWVLLGCSCA